MPPLDITVLQLPPRYLAMVRKLLRDHLPQAEIWAYGSRVNGDSHEASDLDLVVLQPKDLTQAAAALWEAQEAFVESDLPIRVELLDWARLPEAFHREIESRYVIVQPRENSGSGF